MLTTYNLKMPHAVYGGENAMDNIAAIIKTLNAKKVAMFTDKGLRSLGLFGLTEDVVKTTGVSYYVLDDLPPEPSYMAVQKIVDEFKVSGADLIVACGGGSVMDAAKLASVLVTDEYGVKELLDNPGMARKCVPIVLIPTTAGTGAEVTPNAIVGVPEKELKIGIVNENMIADYVILDARLIKNLPRKIAAATGVDALAHCIECFTSNKANPFSDMYALEGCDLILNNIERACDDPEAMEEKNRMQMAAYYGGLAITASGTTAVHALSYPLGGKYHIAHGVSNAVLLAPVMRFNAQDPAFRERLALGEVLQGLCGEAEPQEAEIRQQIPWHFSGQWKEASAQMSRCAAMVRDPEAMEQMSRAIGEELGRLREQAARKAAAGQEAAEGGEEPEKNRAGELCRAYRYYDMRICQKVFLDAMLDYYKAGGRSRGSAVYREDTGEIAVPELVSFTLDGPGGRAHAGEIQEIRLDPETMTCSCSRRPVRPLSEIPEGEAFEAVWKQYRERTYVEEEVVVQTV